MVDRRTFLEGGLTLTAAMGAPSLGEVARAEAGHGFETTGSPWPLRNSEAFIYRSKAVGDDMAIGLWSNVGQGPLRAGGTTVPLEVVYVLDGSFALAVAASVCRLLAADRIDPGFPPVLLVGVDYPEHRPNARTRDYTMRESVPEYLNKLLDVGSPQTTPGGAEKFLEFLEKELDPFIRAKYPVKDGPAGIFGDSFGGTFTFFAFMKQSKLFDRYWLGSPGIFETSSDYVAAFEATLKRRLVHPTKMFLSIGTKEMAGGVDIYEDIGRNFNRMLSALRRNPSNDLAWSSKIYDGYTHTSVLLPALNDAFLYLYGRSAR